MSWIANFVRPKLRALVGKDVPENLWHKCTKCEQMLFHRDLEDSLHVCRHCQNHLRIPLKKRLALLFDEGNYSVVSVTKPQQDPLKFKDLKKYTDRLKEARSKTGEEDATLVVKGFIGGQPAVVVAFDFGFMGGSMGMAVGNAMIDGAKAAIDSDAGFIVIPSSGGARMQEGILSLMQMARTTVAVDMVKEAGLPYIVILTDPTAGGVTASFAMLGDITLAEPKATICFSGRRVIEQTIRQKLPEDFQTAEFLLEKGMIDQIVERKYANKTVGTLLSYLLDGRRKRLPIAEKNYAIQNEKHHA